MTDKLQKDIYSPRKNNTAFCFIFPGFSTGDMNSDSTPVMLKSHCSQSTPVPFSQPHRKRVVFQDWGF